VPGGDALFGLERTVSGAIEQNVRRALLPAVGIDNLRISVTARLNTDQQETNETIFDPDGRVERSVRVSRENDTAQNSDGSAAATVTEELPEDALGDTATTLSSEESERRDETTEYAISNRTVATRSDGYRIDGLSIAVVLNRANLGVDAADQAAVDARITELRGLVVASAGADEKRGDMVTVSALAFAAATQEATSEGPGVAAFFATHAGSLIRAGALLAATGLILAFAVRPALRLAGAAQQAPSLPEASDLPQLPSQPSGPQASPEDDPAADIVAKLDNTARKRLERIVTLDEDKAVAVLKEWLSSADRKDMAA
jgi:flagellar M-ring protein FliF